MNNKEARNATIEAYRRHLTLFETRRSSAGGRRISPFLLKFSCLLPPGARILDFGCGCGHDARYLASRGFAVTGVDATPEFIASARKRCRRARFILADMTTFQASPRTFDAVLANASLLHLPKSAMPRILGRLRKCMVPGGILAATFHNGPSEGIRESTWIPGRYFASYLKEELARMITKAGFEIAELRGVTSEDRKGRWLNLIARR